MIESVGTLYAGHIDFEKVGFDSTPANDRSYSDEQLSLIHI